MFATLAAGLIITARDKTSAVLKTIGAGFDNMRSKGEKLRAGLSAIGGGLRTLARAGLLVAGVFGGMGLAASKFETQMSAVRAVMQDATDAEFSTLEAEIKRLGATTKFSATEAAAGAENLARAGFDAAEQVAALSGVMDAAAADGIDLAVSSNIIANNVRAFGLEAGAATKVADVLALTSAKTNTNMVQLGEGLKMVASTANQLGLPIEDTTAALGILANAGLQGGVGGTALNNMLLKLATVSDAGKKKLNGLGIAIQDSHGNLLPLPQLIGNIATGMEGIPGNLERTALMTDLFGIRGQKAAGNLVTAFNKMGTEGAGSINELFEAIQNADGAAKVMAEERLNNLAGQMTLVKSAVEGLSIELMSPIIEALTGHVKLLADSFSLLATGAQQADSDLIDLGDRTDKMIKSDAAMFIAEMGAGMRDFSDQVKVAIDWVGQMKAMLTNSLGETSTGGRAVGFAIAAAFSLAAAFGVVATVIGVVAVPVIAIATIGFESLALAAGVLFSALWPIALVFGALSLFVAATAKEGQSFGDRFVEVLTNIATFVTGFFKGFVSGYMEHMAPVFERFKAAGEELWEGALKPIFNAINEAFGATSSSGEDMGSIVGNVFGWLSAKGAKLSLFIVEVLVPAFVWAAKNIAVPMIRAFGQIAGGYTDLITGARSVKDSVTSIFKGMINNLLNTVFLPYKLAIIGIMQAASAIGAINAETAASVTGFLNAAPGTLLADPARGGTGETSGRGGDKDRDLTGEMSAWMATVALGNQDPNIALSGNLETKVEGCIESTLQVDGKALNVAGSEAKFELAQRGGFKMSPFLQTQLVTNGDVAR